MNYHTMISDLLSDVEDERLLKLIYNTIQSFIKVLSR